MKVNIKQYEYKKVEIEQRVIELPTEVKYYFETGVRRSIMIKPIFTSWNKEKFNKEEELINLEVVCLYNSSECRAEMFTISVSRIEDIFYCKNHKHKSFVEALVNDWFDERTKEQFEADLEYTFNKIGFNN